MIGRVLLWGLSFLSMIIFIGGLTDAILGEGQGSFKIKRFLTPLDAKNHFIAGLTAHYNLSSPDIKNAIASYRETIERSPLYPEVWLALADAYRQMGQKSEALKAIESYTSLRPTDPRVLWRAGVFTLTINEPSLASEYMKGFLLYAPEQQRRVYGLYLSLGYSTAYLIENLLPDAPVYHNGYVSYLLSIKKVEELLQYKRKAGLHRLNERLRVGICDFFIGEGLYAEADEVWQTIVPTTDEILYNGGFERQPLQGCFGWRVTSRKGVESGLDSQEVSEGERSLKVVFKGENVGLPLVRQLILVRPNNRYRLTASLKTYQITTTNGPYLLIRGMRCKGVNYRGEVLTGTNDWKTVEFDFKVPPDCSIIEVSLRRDYSYKFNNRITGVVWLDGVRITKTGN